MVKQKAKRSALLLLVLLLLNGCRIRKIPEQRPEDISPEVFGGEPAETDGQGMGTPADEEKEPLPGTEPPASAVTVQETVPDSKPESQKSEYDIYAEYLTGLDDADLYFDVIYLNDDDIPELVTHVQGGDNTVEFFTAEEDTVVPLGSIEMNAEDFLWDTLSFVPRRGYLRRTVYMNMGMCRKDLYYSLEDGRIVLTGERIADQVEGKYNADGAEVSEESYDAFDSERFPCASFSYETKAAPSCTRNHPLTAGYCVNLIVVNNRLESTYLNEWGFTANGKSTEKVAALLRDEAACVNLPMSVEVQKAYADMLAQIGVSGNYDVAFLYADEDDNPDMLVQIQEDRQPAYNLLFTFSDGKAVQSGYFDVPGLACVPHGGMLFAYDGVEAEYKYRLSGNSETCELLDGVYEEQEYVRNGDQWDRVAHYFRVGTGDNPSAENPEITEEEYRKLYDGLRAEREAGSYESVPFKYDSSVPFTWRVMFADYDPAWVNADMETLSTRYLQNLIPPDTDASQTLRYAMIHFDRDDSPDLAVMTKQMTASGEPSYGITIFRRAVTGTGDLAYAELEIADLLPSVDESQLLAGLVYQPYQSSALETRTVSLSYYDPEIDDRRDGDFTFYGFFSNKSSQVQHTAWWAKECTSYVVGGYEEGDVYAYSVYGMDKYKSVYSREYYLSLRDSLLDPDLMGAVRIDFEDAHVFDGTLAPPEEEKRPAIPEGEEAEWVRIFRNQVEYEKGFSFKSLGQKFSLIHLDDDDIPELIISDIYEDDSAPDNIVTYYSIYSYTDDDIVETDYTPGYFDYIAGAGIYRKSHIFAAYGPDTLLYCDINKDSSTYGLIDDYTKNDSHIYASGFSEYYTNDEYEGIPHELSAEELSDLLSVYWPVTSENKGDGETKGAEYRMETRYEPTAENIAKLPELVPELIKK